MQVIFAFILSTVIVANTYMSMQLQRASGRLRWHDLAVSVASFVFPLRTWGVIWSGNCFCANVGIACRECLDVSKLHVHVAGEYHFQWNIFADWLDYVAAVSRVVLTLFADVLLPSLSSKEEIRCTESWYCLLWAWAVCCRTRADVVSAFWTKKQSIFVLETAESEALAFVEAWLTPLKFYDLHGRTPGRQNVRTDEQRAEDALAQRWDRLLAKKASLGDELLNAYNRIFAAAEIEDDDMHLEVCIAVGDFFEKAQRLPKRQLVDSDEKRAEDALARRWDRLLAEKASVSEQLLSSYSAIFAWTSWRLPQNKAGVRQNQRPPPTRSCEHSAGHDLDARAARSPGARSRVALPQCTAAAGGRPGDTIMVQPSAGSFRNAAVFLGGSINPKAATC